MDMAKVECELMTQDAIDVEIAGNGTVLQDKSVDVDYNGTIVVKADEGFDGLKSVEINTNVPKRFECGDAVFDTNAYNGGMIYEKITKVDISCIVNARTTSLSGLFKGLKSLTDIVGIDSLDTSNITTMSGMFEGCLVFSQFDKLKSFNTSKVKNMEHMFAICKKINNLDFVKNWDVSNVENFCGIFCTCNFSSGDFSSWNVSKASNFRDIFSWNYGLESLDLSSWDVSNVTTMRYLFNGCKNLKWLDLSNWNTPKAKDLWDCPFRECHRLNTLIGDHTLQDVENGLRTFILLNNTFLISSSPLRFSSILALVNGFADMTGKTAETLTISASSYNKMYNDDDTMPSADVIAERQARIAAICAAKNWNFAH